MADTLVKEKGLSFRTAHKIVGALVREAIDQGIKPHDINTEMLDKAANEVIAKPVKLSAKALSKALDPIESIKSRKGFGGVAPKAVKESLKNRLNKLNEEIYSLNEKKKKLAMAQEELQKAVKKILSSSEKQN